MTMPACDQGDDLTERFFRNLTELAVIHCLNSERPPAAGVQPSGTPPQPQLNFVATDALVRLVVCLVTGGSLLPSSASCMAAIFGCFAALAGIAIPPSLQHIHHRSVTLPAPEHVSSLRRIVCILNPKAGLSMSISQM